MFRNIGKHNHKHFCRYPDAIIKHIVQRVFIADINTTKTDLFPVVL